MNGIVRLLLIAELGFLSIYWTIAQAAEPSVHSRDVVVNRTSEGFTVDVDIVVAVPISTAWAVITDFQNMARFIPNLTESQVLERKPNWARLHQKGYSRFGPFKFEFETTRDIQMTPETEMRSHGIAGNLKNFESTTRLTTVGDGTRLEYHVEAQPSFWIPPLLGPLFVRDQTAEQFSALVGEMTRRR